jgi:hypothetical protein
MLKFVSKRNPRTPPCVWALLGTSLKLSVLSRANSEVSLYSKILKMGIELPALPYAYDGAAPPRVNLAR